MMKRFLVAVSLSAAAVSMAAVSPQPMKLGYVYDITREKVPTGETLRRVADIVSSLGYGQMQLYFKDNFAYPDHKEVWQGRAHVTPEEIREFDRYCAAKGLELVPYQSAFGHLEPWMKFERYRKLAENEGKYFCTALNREMNGAALCPTAPESLDFLNGLFDVLLPCFSSRYANLGCDEVWDLHSASGKSAEEIRRKGSGRVYLEFLLKMHAQLKARGKTMMFWSDIIRNYPHLVNELPEDVVALDWSYEGSAPYNLTTAALKHAPCRYYVCPGTSSWCSFFGRHHNMRANVQNAWHWARRNGAEGLLLTDWGDNGHPQPWIVSLPSLVFTSMLVKNGKAPSDVRKNYKFDQWRFIVGATAKLTDNASLNLFYLLPDRRIAYLRCERLSARHRSPHGKRHDALPHFDADEEFQDAWPSCRGRLRFGARQAPRIGRDARSVRRSAVGARRRGASRSARRFHRAAHKRRQEFARRTLP